MDQEKTQEKTKVIFRSYQGGDIIAIFPEELGDNTPHTCSSYMHMGQHSTCDPDYVIQDTRPATVQEYSDLKQELEGIGYNLEVIQRNRSYFTEIRLDKLRRSRKVTYNLINFSPENLNRMKETGLTCDITSQVKTVTFDNDNIDEKIKFHKALEGVKILTFQYRNIYEGDVKRQANK